MTYFGVADDGVALPGLPHASDAKHCRRCGRPYVYDAVYLGHLGRYHCPTGDSSRPAPEVAAEDVELRRRQERGVHAAHAGRARGAIELPLPGLYNVYNALAAAALASRLGASLDDIAAGLQAVSPAFGRAETVHLDGRDLSILLVKNPAGANEVVRTLALEPGEHRPAGRPERPHRRRARRLVGVGRRLRAPRPAPAPRRVRGHAGAPSSPSG